MLQTQPHSQYVSGLRWACGGGGSARLFTASYDSTVRWLDLGAGGPAGCFGRPAGCWLRGAGSGPAKQCRRAARPPRPRARPHAPQARTSTWPGFRRTLRYLPLRRRPRATWCTWATTREGSPRWTCARARCAARAACSGALPVPGAGSAALAWQAQGRGAAALGGAALGPGLRGSWRAAAGPCHLPRALSGCLPFTRPLRAQAVFEPLDIHSRKVNTISLEPGEGRLLATSSTDGSVAIWDVRKLGEGAPGRSLLPGWGWAGAAAWGCCLGLLLGCCWGCWSWAAPGLGLRLGLLPAAAAGLLLGWGWAGAAPGAAACCAWATPGPQHTPACCPPAATPAPPATRRAPCPAGEAGARAKAKAGAAPLCTVAHAKSCQSATWAPDGSRRLLSVSFDNTLRIWGPGEAAGGQGAQEGQLQLQQRVVMDNDNNTGRCAREQGRGVRGEPAARLAGCCAAPGGRTAGPQLQPRPAQQQRPCAAAAAAAAAAAGT